MDYESINTYALNRRDFIKAAAALGTSLVVNPWSALAESIQSNSMRARKIPSTGEELPVVGLGTWQQFDVDSDPVLTRPLKAVLQHLFQSGGTVIDTSPMYGRAETVLGTLLEDLGQTKKAFLATKVWTRGRDSGIRQMNQSLRKLNVSTIDLMQVHNLVDWQTHLRTLQDWKEQGKVRYLGVTHYTASAFNELKTVMTNHDLDFVQLPYSIEFTRAEQTLLPLAEDRGIAVIVNRPFEAGSLFRGVQNEPLPEWASEIGCSSWAQYFLKYILAHPSVTCVIPGTSNPDHMLDNARAGMGVLPDQAQRQQMRSYWKSI
ncbi:MAG: aldo/keto reductase [bacterium]